MELRINPCKNLKGKLDIPGDKSITQRAVILGSLAKGKTVLKGFLESGDCINSLDAFRNMGVDIYQQRSTQYLIDGVGLYGLKEPVGVIECGNSATLMRLLIGLLVNQNFYSVLIGDHSLVQRPMDRIIQPLKKMGARVWSRKNKYAPISIKGTSLTGVNYKLPIASAQLKSALLLAGLYAQEGIKVIEPVQTRDHTERLLRFFGITLKKEGGVITLNKQNKDFPAQEVIIPSDISSAAFFLAAGLITQGSELILKNVGINPTRTGILDVISKMGGRYELLKKSNYSGEPTADILIKSSQLKSTIIQGNLIPRLIDEIPIITVMASQAEGNTIIRDAAELRVKETDRIRVLAAELSKLGVQIEEYNDGMLIKGPTKIKGGVRVNSYGDHRIAMALAIAGLIADDDIIIKDSQCIATSFPQFISILKRFY